MNDLPEESPAKPPPVGLARRLPEGYYLDNFETVLRTVAGRYEDLLRPDELAFFAAFDALSLPGRRLYVRLVSRRGSMFRRDRLDYAEVGSILAATAELQAAGFADRAEDAEAGELLPLLLRDELAAMAAALLDGVAPAQARKDQLIAALVDGVDGAGLRRAIGERVEVVRLLRTEQVLIFRLLFFGNLSQDWSELVLADLGVVRYESYEVKRELRRFPSRDAIDHYLKLKASKEAVLWCLESGATDQALELSREVLAAAGSWHPTTRRLADRVFLEVAQHLERRGDLRQALEYYAAAVAPPARERAARILARFGSVARALALCDEIGRDPRDETEVLFARRFAHRLRRMRGELVPPPPRRRRPITPITLDHRDGEPVERLALAALAEVGRQGFFAENWLWRNLFGLAFWDIVFAPVDGAFQHPFQLGPLDLDSPDFRAARTAAIERRLAELRADPRPGERLMAVYDEKKEIANRLVSWHDGLRGPLELALSRLAGRHLAWVFDRLSRDLSRYRRGFPDLFVVKDGDPGFELFEVKAPGDQLRPEQRAWIDHFNDGGLPTSILRVGWSS